MIKEKQSILVVGFNVRPLVYSLYNAGFEVYAVDFFGDLDLFPYIKDCLILTNELKTSYEDLKENYKTYLAKFTIDLLKKYPNIDYLLIGSGLDDAFQERKMILEHILRHDYNLISVNNNLEIIRKARDIENLFKYLESQGFPIADTISLQDYNLEISNIRFPIIFKKRKSSGGTNVYKIDNEDQLKMHQDVIKETCNPKEWLLQEYIEGIPISCTIISNGRDTEIISINRQIIGLKLLNPPKPFMYCGNVVPAYLTKLDRNKVIEITNILAKKLKLRGINGFDFVIKDHVPYLMEINPRIPGSIRASEESLGLNLLNLHIKSFTLSKWEKVKNILKNSEMNTFTTKLIVFAPNNIQVAKIKKINELDYIHDKSPPKDKIHKNQPICTILYNDKNFADSFFNALKIADKIYKIIK